MKKVIQFTVILSLMILVLTACIPVSYVLGIPNKAPASTPQAMQAQTATREAQVQSVEIQMLKTNPAQVNAVVRGNLTEACATFADPQLSFTTNTFMIKLLTVSPSDRGCLQVTTPFEQTIPLNTTDLPAGDYTVKVNGVSAVFTLPAGNSQTAVPGPSGEPSQTKTFRSGTYHYQVSYPADWTVQVTTENDSPGKLAEYVTFASVPGGKLPNVTIYSLTGAPPFTGYENCQPNLIFRGLDACRISVPAGQIPATELIVFHNGDQNFEIVMQYEGQEALGLFDQFITSFQFTKPIIAGEPANPTSCTDPVTLTPAKDNRIVYKGISFILDPTLGESVRVKECPTVPFSIDLEPGTAHPSYFAFSFPIERKRIDFQPELRVYTVSGDMQSYLYPLKVLEDLHNMVSQQLEPITWFDGAPLHVKRSYLSFAKGKGVRGVVEYAQDIFFFTNNGLLYEYDGLTDDSRLYVNVRFPVAVLFLMDIENSDPRTNVNPQAITIPEWTEDYNQQGKIIEAYNQEALRRFDQMTAGDFTPSLQVLDALVGSLEIAAP